MKPERGEHLPLEAVTTGLVMIHMMEITEVRSIVKCSLRASINSYFTCR
jgi:hypothetical protein